MLFDLEVPEINSREFSRYTIKNHDPYGFFKISKTGGGTVPRELSGAYTSLTEAEKAITAYELLNPPKVAPPATETSSPPITKTKK